MVREQSPQAQSTSVPDCLPLQSGDYLTRPEFERRYAAAPRYFQVDISSASSIGSGNVIALGANPFPELA